MPGVEDDLMRIAREAAYQGDYQKAIYLCEQVLERDPRSIDARDFIVECKSNLETEELDAISQEVYGRQDEESLGKVDAYLAQHPESAEALHLRAKCSMTPEVALEYLNKALAIAPEFAAALHTRSYTHAYLGRIEEADLDASKVIELEPASAANWIVRARLRLEANRLQEGLKDLRTALRLDPGYPDGLAALAHAALLLGHFEKVLKLGQRARKAGCDPALLMLDEAEALLFLRREEEAKVLYQSVLSETAGLGAGLRYAQVLIQLRQPESAIEELDRCGEGFGEIGAWHATYAEALLQLGRRLEALTALEAARATSQAALDAGEPHSRYDLSWCHALRASLASEYELTELQLDTERARALELLKQATSEDATNWRYAKAERVFDSLLPKLNAPVTSASKEDALFD